MFPASTHGIKSGSVFAGEAKTFVMYAVPSADGCRRVTGAFFLMLIGYMIFLFVSSFENFNFPIVLFSFLIKKSESIFPETTTEKYPFAKSSL